MAMHVVLGMHRSGTSLVMRVLEMAGCDLGPAELRIGPARDNPDGFNENRAVVALNDAALAAAGATWFDVLPVVDGGLDHVDREQFQRWAATALSWVSPERPSAVKDPRMIPLFPLWREVLADPTVILPIRHPVEVAHSLHARDQTPLEVGAALWEFHVVRALESTRGLRRHIVHHRQLLEDPVGTVRSLVPALADPQLVTPDDVALHATVDPSLHRAYAEELDSTFLAQEQLALYWLLAGSDDPDQLPTLAVSPGSLEQLGRYRSSRLDPTPLGRSRLSTGRPSPGRRRTAVVVQGCRLPVFEPSLRACRETWVSRPHDDVDVFFAYGNPCDDHDLTPIETFAGRALPAVPDGEVEQHGDLLAIGCSDLIAHQSDSLLRKRLLSLGHLLEHDDHDAYLLTCASSYVDLPVLAAHVATVDLGGLLQGPTFVAENGRVVVSGSAILLSRDLAQRLVDDSADLLTVSQYRYADDVSISDWVADRISDTDPAAMADRVRAGRPATTDNTFRQPPVPMLDFRAMETDRHQRVDGAYHYHFDTDKPSTMRRFHQRYYLGRPSPATGRETIFVQIASYRDRDLPRTIASALREADHPERLRFGICWQYDEETLEDLDPYLADDRFRIDEVYYRKSHGCTWARSRANRMFDDEDFYLQIDAHTRFATSWDTTLVEMLSGIDAEKPILTVYPPAFTIDVRGEDVLASPGVVQVLALESIDMHLETRQCTRVAPDQDAPGRSPFVAAGFLFARGSFCREVPYDPWGYFAGEEIALAARAFSWGYDFFHPSEHVVWHRYDHGEPLHWSDRGDAIGGAQSRSRERLTTLLLGDHRTLAPYGLGPMRDVRAFEAYCGIDFAAAAAGSLLPEPTELELSIELDTEGIEPRDDYEVWVFAILGGNDQELHREDIHDSRVLTGEDTSWSITAEFSVTPAKYLLWPKSRTLGFGERRVRDLDPTAITAVT